MIISDNGREFDSEWLVAIANGSIKEYDTYLYSERADLCRLRYMNIRNVLSGHLCCSKLSLREIKEDIKDKDKLKRIENVFGYTQEEVEFYVYAIELLVPGIE